MIYVIFCNLFLFFFHISRSMAACIPNDPSSGAVHFKWSKISSKPRNTRTTRLELPSMRRGQSRMMGQPFGECQRLLTANIAQNQPNILYVFQCFPLSIIHVYPTQRPVDIFESDFIIAVFAPFVKWCKDSSVDYGYLVGALALSAAGVREAIYLASWN